MNVILHGRDKKKEIQSTKMKECHSMHSITSCTEHRKTTTKSRLCEVSSRAAAEQEKTMSADDG
jgi:hypothetical protein